MAKLLFGEVLCSSLFLLLLRSLHQFKVSLLGSVEQLRVTTRPLITCYPELSVTIIYSLIIVGRLKMTAEKSLEEICEYLRDHDFPESVIHSFRGLFYDNIHFNHSVGVICNLIMHFVV